MSGRVMKARVWNAQYKTLSPVNYLNWRGPDEIEVDYDANLNEPRLVDGENIFLEWASLFVDSRGREVFEGDLCRLSTREGSAPICPPQVVSFSNYGYWAYGGTELHRFVSSGYWFEVIGNIHQNPELLEVPRG